MGKKYILLLIVSIVAPLYLFAKESCQHTKNSFKCVKYVRNYDADTITFNIDNLHPLIGDKINIRVNGVDTPEIKTKNSCEKQQARNAKKLVANLLKQAKRIDLENIKRGKYFRVVADVILDGKNLKDYLLKNKLAYSYDGGKKRKIDWCSHKLRDTASDLKKIN